MSRVLVQNLVKRYGAMVAVNDVTLDVAEGEFLTMLGSSGCGKTTTLRCVAGLESPSEGEIFFDERPMSKVPPYARSCGMVFQNYALFPHMTVAENVAYGLMANRYRKVGLPQRVGILMSSTLYGIPAEDRQRVQEALDKVELGKYGRSQPGQLSGGQQQRVALARALITQPRVLLFDEPLGALDAKLRVKMREEIRRIQKRAGITTLYVTHDQEEALAISDRIAVMNNGRIVQLGSPEDLYTRPRTRFIADFIGLGNIFEATRSGDRTVALERERLLLQVSAPVPNGGSRFSVAMRPEALRFLADHEEAVNAIPGVVKLRMFMGNSVRYVVNAQEAELVVSVGQGSPRFDVDQTVRLTVSPEDVLVLESD
ncbi:MAG: ABC transporter ATP-binding protein [Candidatus Xenobia bacterium]